MRGDPLRPTGDKTMNASQLAKVELMLLADISEIAAELADIASTYAIEADPECDDDCYVDVRLQVNERGDWTLHSGDASYDTDHTGSWGAGSVCADQDKEACEETARELVNEALDSMAQGIA
jgi:hypothetical protein